MTDRAAIVPTAAGPVGAIVSEPDGPARGALMLFQGGGPAGRSGINAVWARMARGLAEQGIVVLRFDFVLEGDGTLLAQDASRHVGWRRDADLVLARDVAAWLRERVGALDLFVAGSCHGGRVALELAAGDPAIHGTFLAVPYLWHLPPHKRDRPLAATDREYIDRRLGRSERSSLDDDADLAAGFRAILGRGPLWILVGDRDDHELAAVQRLLGPAGAELEVDVAPGMELHSIIQPDVQEEVTRRLTDRLLAAYADRERGAGVQLAGR